MMMMMALQCSNLKQALHTRTCQASINVIVVKNFQIKRSQKKNTKKRKPGTDILFGVPAENLTPVNVLDFVVIFLQQGKTVISL